MQISVKEIASLVNGKIIGDESLSFSGINNIEEANDNDISLLFRRQYYKYLDTTKAKILLTSAEAPRTRNDITYIEVEKPNLAFQKIISKYFAKGLILEGIDPSASVSETAILGDNVALGKNVVICDGVIIGDNTKIFHNSVIMDNTTVGSGSLFYPNVTVRENCKIGKNVILHPGVVVGSDGFGYTPDENGQYNKIPQIGNVIIEDNVEIGSNTTIDRAALGSTLIKTGTKIDNLVQIAHNVQIGKSTAISAQTGISGSTKVGDFCVFGGQVGLADHIELTDKVMVGAQSGIGKSVPKPGVYFGTPIKDIKDELRIQSHIKNLDKYAKKMRELEKRIIELEGKTEE